MAYGSAADYIAAYQGLGPDQIALSDVVAPASTATTSASDLSSLLGAQGLDLSSLLGLAGLAGPLVGGQAGDALGIAGGLGATGLGLATLNPLALLGGLASLGMGIGDLFSGGRSSTGPGSATADIAAAASNGDPVLSLLGMGAGALGSDVPISSSQAAPTYGPYFDAARKLEDLLRWGPGGLTDPKAQALDATTLKQAMHQLGNPDSGGPNTLIPLQNTFNSGSKYLTPDNINLLLNQTTPQEGQLIRNSLKLPPNGMQNLLQLTNPPGGNPQIGSNQRTQNNNQSSLAQLLAMLHGGGFAFGWQ